MLPHVTDVVPVVLLTKEAGDNGSQIMVAGLGIILCSDVIHNVVALRLINTCL